RPAGLGEAYDRRFSFCCARRNCRKRKTPASLRFLGPKVYVAGMVIVISAMQDGATAALQKLSQLVGVSRRTIARWRKWWLSVFAASPFRAQISELAPQFASAGSKTNPHRSTGRNR